MQLVSRKEKLFLIWVDIMGFEALAREIAQRTGISERKVRDDFIATIGGKIEELEADGELVGKKYGQGEDWLLVTRSLDLIFAVVSKLLDHNTQYKQYEKIPLEIGIGVGEYDKWAKLEGRKLLIENSTIDFLKTYIIDYYRKWYKKKSQRRSPESTFIVLTESAYEELESLDKETCTKVEYRSEKDDRVQDIVFYVADLQKFLERGQVLAFLSKAGMRDSKLYARIDRVYIPPLEYEEIRSTLKNERIIFITGTAEYGKTYTAVRLLWEYYQKGYEPIWYKGEEKYDRKIVRDRLKNIENDLKPHRIIYFEDPFGKTRYERREDLENEIGTIIDSIGNVKDVYVIVTSRDEVFKQFKKETLSLLEIDELEKKLNIKRPSYDMKKKEDMLLVWARSKGCVWLKDASLKSAVIENMKEMQQLPTPLSMREFVISTVIVSSRDELQRKMREKSLETTMRFAKEIRSMTDDKIVFLLFPFISDFPIERVREEYEKACPHIRMKDPMAFDKVLDWFLDDKITIANGRIVFSHDSYSAAMRFFVSNELWSSRFTGEVFRKILLNLSVRYDAMEAMANFMSDYYSSSPKDVRKTVLLNLSKSDSPLILGIIADIIANNFRSLEDDTLSELLSRLSKHEVNIPSVATMLVLHYDEMPPKARSLLKTLVQENEVAARMLIHIVAENFDKTAEELRDVFFDLSKLDSMAEDVALAADRYSEWFQDSAKNQIKVAHDQAVITLANSGHARKRISALGIIESSLSKSDLSLSLTLLAKLAKDSDMRVKETAERLAQDLRKHMLRS